EVDGLRLHFPIRRGVLRRVAGHVKAVDGVSLALARGRTLALVGESGCGKTTVGKAILRLIPPTGGRVLLDGRNLADLPRRALRPLRRRAQMIFQDPFASLDPRLSVGEIVAEGMDALGAPGTTADRTEAVAALLCQVGLDPDAARRYPHEFSGGQRQRIAIARALAVQPELVICDEPTSALDVSVQAQILNLLKSLQDELGLAYLFITHNFAVVEYLAHEVAVMYLGRIVERGPADAVLRSPRHPYTEALLSAVPRPHLTDRRAIVRLAGETPSPANPPSGCHFHPRCPRATERCRAEYPEAREAGPEHFAHCFF
ncbi:MAG: ATP-binding cassette domain-containing protein, partial [Candidatus Accumulibacter sp.]|nr:ATP-binding cassette domain-containing protein [Accumulibacter sp.]